jgi:hypothetical protein
MMRERSAGGETGAADVPTHTEISVVTGAFGFTGKYIVRGLLSRGKSVRTLTAHPERVDPFGGTVDVSPVNFGDRSALLRSLRGASTLYNTYWVRFPYRQVTYEEALANTRVLLRAAEDAACEGSSISASRTHQKNHRTRISAARRPSSARSARRAYPTQSCVRQSSSGPRTS